MPRHNLLAPISVLLAGLVLIGLLFIGAPPSPQAAPLLQPYPAETSSPYPGESTASPTAGSTTPTLTESVTSTATTGTPTPTVSPTATQDSTPTPTRRPPQGALATATAEPLPTETADLACTPGDSITISGTGAPRAGYLVYFGARVVGGGSIGPDGRFSTTLTIGDEGPGIYEVVAEERGTRQVLRQLTCAVPEVERTPIPTRFP